MNLKVGIDLVEIPRIKKAVKNSRFVARVYSKAEQEYFEQKARNKIQSMAANWSAKEAFSKAIGTGIRGFAMNEIEVLRDETGKPYIVLSENIKNKFGNCVVDVSLTHTGDTAGAVVLINKK